MIFSLMSRFISRGRVRFACAVAGVASAVGAVVFMFSLTATNDAQAPAVARKLAAPWNCWQIERGGDTKKESRKGRRQERNEVKPDLKLPLVGMTVDYRPGGRVLQGPPMRVVIANAPKESPYENAKLVEGRWVNDSAKENEIVATYGSMIRSGRGTPPPIGSMVTFVGSSGKMVAKLVGYLDAQKTPMMLPNVFANKAAFIALEKEEHGTICLWREIPKQLETKEMPQNVQTPESIAPMFTSDAQRNFGRARTLLLWAAALTALCLLVNSLLLSIEANRKKIAILRMIGLTRGGTVRLVLCESCAATVLGTIFGIVISIGILYVYVTTDAQMFPSGVSIDWKSVWCSSVIALGLAAIATLFALRPVLSVRPLEAVNPIKVVRKHRVGMLVAFAFGFGAFIAVEVWGASLMKVFVPSTTWPDAIVSILPGGVSSFDIEKLKGIKNIKRVHELVPLQMNFEPEEELKGFGSKRPQAIRGRGGRMMKQCRNVLFLGSDWLPEFKFVEGTREEAVKELARTNACVITAMMARARKLKLGDELVVANGFGERKFVAKLPIVGIVDLNWHLVTSRGLVRGLNRMPVNTDGPAFVSFDTCEMLDARPAMMVKMTHLWLDYQDDFLKEHGVFPAGRIVEEEIRKALGNPHDSTIRLHARDEISDGTLAHGTNIIGSMARIPFIFLAVLSIGFIAMLVASADAVKREFVVLRAVGATRNQLAIRLLAEAVKTAVCGIILGFPCGALVGWLFTSGTRAAMANWGLPPAFAVPWQVVVEGTVGAVVFMLLVSIPTSLILINRAIKRRM